MNRQRSVIMLDTSTQNSVIVEHVMVFWITQIKNIYTCNPLTNDVKTNQFNVKTGK